MAFIGALGGGGGGGEGGSALSHVDFKKLLFRKTLSLFSRNVTCRISEKTVPCHYIVGINSHFIQFDKT